MDFQVQCRTARTPSPVRGSTPPPRGPYQMPEPDWIITGQRETLGKLAITTETVAVPRRTTMTVESVAVPHRTGSSAPISPPKSAPAVRPVRHARSADAGRSAPYR